MRATLGVAAGAAVAALAALITGEYEFTAVVAAVAGIVLGAVVGEVVVGVAGGRRRRLVPAAAVVAAAGLLWGGWRASTGGVAPYPATAWLGAALAAGSAAVRVSPLRPRRSGG